MNIFKSFGREQLVLYGLRNETQVLKYIEVEGRIDIANVVSFFSE
ncbi:hypothetical protein ACQKKK_19660 [Peribacillus sp. NPDC006672]